MRLKLGLGPIRGAILKRGLKDVADVRPVDQAAQLAVFAVRNGSVRERGFALGHDRGAGFNFQTLQARGQLAHLGPLFVSHFVKSQERVKRFLLGGHFQGNLLRGFHGGRAFAGKSEIGRYGKKWTDPGPFWSGV